MNDNRPQLAKNIESLRQSRGMSKSDLARESGVSRPSISQYEAGHRRPKIDAVLKIASALRTSASKLDPYGVYESSGNYGMIIREDVLKYASQDIYVSLGNWLRVEATDSVRSAVLLTAEIGGFRDPRIRNMLHCH